MDVSALYDPWFYSLCAEPGSDTAGSTAMSHIQSKQLHDKCCNIRATFNRPCFLRKVYTIMRDVRTKRKFGFVDLFGT